MEGPVRNANKGLVDLTSAPLSANLFAQLQEPLEAVHALAVSKTKLILQIKQKTSRKANLVPSLNWLGGDLSSNPQRLFGLMACGDWQELGSYVT